MTHCGPCSWPSTPRAREAGTACSLPAGGPIQLSHSPRRGRNRARRGPYGDCHRPAHQGESIHGAGLLLPPDQTFLWSRAMLKKCLVPKGPLIAGLPVLLWGWAGEGGARFVASFQQTWGRLGPAVTDRLLEYWHPVTSEGRWVVDGPAHLDGRPARTLYPGRHLEFSAS